MQMVSGTSSGLPAGLYNKVSRYRHEVFVRRLGWQLNTPEGVDIDQFDREDTVYVVAEDDQGRVAGCGRLLPTTRPYLLGEVFPQLLNGAPPPCSPDIWELSRYCAVDLDATPLGQHDRLGRLGQFGSPVGLELLTAAKTCARELGARQLITVSPLGVERLMRRAGLRGHRAGPPMIIDGHPIFACLLDLEGD